MAFRRYRRLREVFMEVVDPAPLEFKRERIDPALERRAREAG